MMGDGADNDGGEARPPRWFGEAIGVHRELAMLGVKVKALDEHKMPNEKMATINQAINASSEQTFRNAAALVDRSIANLDQHLDTRMEQTAEKAAARAVESMMQQGGGRGWHPVAHQATGGSIVGAVLAILYLLGAIPHGS